MEEEEGNEDKEEEDEEGVLLIEGVVIDFVVFSIDSTFGEPLRRGCGEDIC